MGDIYAPFKKTLLMELVETRIDEMSNDQVAELFEIVKDGNGKPFTIPEADK